MRGTKAKALRKRARELSVGMPYKQLSMIRGIVFHISNSTHGIYKQLKKGRMS